MRVQSLGWKKPVKEGMATHSSILVWRTPWTEEPIRVQSLGSQSRTWLKWQHAQTKRSFVVHCSVAQSCLTLCNPVDCSTPGFPVLHHPPELAQTHVHWVGDAIHSSCPSWSPSPPAFRRRASRRSYSNANVWVRVFQRNRSNRTYIDRWERKDEWGNLLWELALMVMEPRKSQDLPSAVEDSQWKNWERTDSVIQYKSIPEKWVSNYVSLNLSPKTWGPRVPTGVWR